MPNREWNSAISEFSAPNEFYAKIGNKVNAIQLLWKILALCINLNRLKGLKIELKIGIQNHNLQGIRKSKYNGKFYPDLQKFEILRQIFSIPILLRFHRQKNAWRYRQVVTEFRQIWVITVSGIPGSDPWTNPIRPGLSCSPFNNTVKVPGLQNTSCAADPVILRIWIHFFNQWGTQN